MPSLAPSIVEQTITVPGQLSFSEDICSLDADAQAEFVNATLQTIEQVADCDGYDGCVAEITDICGSGQRRLQSGGGSGGSWQLGFEIAMTYTCELADCSSPTDSAVADGVVSGITNSMETSLGSDEFLTVLSQNFAANPGSVDATILLCLAGKHAQMSSFYENRLISQCFSCQSGATWVSQYQLYPGQVEYSILIGNINPAPVLVMGISHCI